MRRRVTRRLAKEAADRHQRAEIAHQRAHLALVQINAALERAVATVDAMSARHQGVSPLPPCWRELVENAGVQVGPGGGGWYYRISRLRDRWDGPYPSPDHTLAAAVRALVARAGDDDEPSGREDEPPPIASGRPFP